jgi:hypothetical protein
MISLVPLPNTIAQRLGWGGFLVVRVVGSVVVVVVVFVVAHRKQGTPDVEELLFQWKPGLSRPSLSPAR